MMKRGMKLVVAVVLVCFIGASLSGCAAQGNGTWGAKKTGALGGALVGAIVGFKERGLAGALVGAAIGGAAGYAVGAMVDYVREKDAAQVYNEYGRDRRIVFEDMQLSKTALQGGEKGNLELHYAVIDPNPSARNKVDHTIEYWKGDQKLHENTVSKTVKPGGYKANFPLSVPKGADEGEYTVVAKLNAVGQTETQMRSFRVFYARNEQGVLQVASVTPY
ncbi:MAG: hypothetical protein D6717_12935 [Gammaproteobacteria bacterium]|nr:MAG: hypothetical protein D6717_12935 [Gammaproteobacteria bacterium]